VLTPRSVVWKCTESNFPARDRTVEPKVVIRLFALRGPTFLPVSHSRFSIPRFASSLHRMSLLLLCLASWLPLISASGTSPSEPSFVPDPSGRGTVGLLWSCILTLWPCVWTAIHLNMPPRHSTPWQRFLTKLPFAAVTLVFPEFMLLLVVLQFRSAWHFANEMNRVIDSWNDSETASREPPKVEIHQSCPASAITSRTSFQRWNLTTAFFGIMGGFQAKFGDGSDFRGDPNTPILTPRLLIRLAKEKMLPPVDNHLCKGRGKSDEIGKLFVIGQVSWFVLQCIGRKASGLPVTLLEINTAVHVACAIGIYTLMWFKPQGATEPLMIDVSKCTACDHFIMENKQELVSLAKNLDPPYHADFYTDTLAFITLISLGVIYGGLHMVAWDAHFPSYAEQILWRVSALTITVSSPIYWIASLDCFIDSEGVSGGFKVLLVLLVIFLPRLYLVTEAFISVRSLPVGAYQTVEWVEFLPHIG